MDFFRVQKVILLFAVLRDDGDIVKKKKKSFPDASPSLRDAVCFLRPSQNCCIYTTIQLFTHWVTFENNLMDEI